MKLILLLLSLVSISQAQPKLYAFPLQRWNSIDNIGNTENCFNLMNNLIDSLATVDGIDGIHVGLHNNYGYLDNSYKSVRIREYNQRLIDNIESKGLECLVAGPSFTKNWGPATRSSLPIINNDSILVIGESTIADNKGYVELKKLSAKLKTLEKYTVAKIRIRVSGTGGTVYINQGNNHLNKLYVKGGSTSGIMTYISLEGLVPDFVFYRGTAGDKVFVSFCTLNMFDSDELQVINDSVRWIGNDRSGFYNCRAPEYSDLEGIWKLAFQSNLFPRKPLVCVSDELNSPVGYSKEFKKLYPLGWPQALASVVDKYTNVCYNLNGIKPYIWVTDPQSLNRYGVNRTCAPVPEGATANYLNYLPDTTPFNLVLWDESSLITDWENLINVTDKFPDRTIAIYAGQVNVAKVFEAIGDRKNEFSYAVFWWGAEEIFALETLRQVESHLK